MYTLSYRDTMGIDVELWRAMIGSWHARQTRLRSRSSFSRKQEEKVKGLGLQLLLLLCVAALIPMLLQLGGDVEQYGWKLTSGQLEIDWDSDENIKHIQEKVRLLLRGCTCKTGCTSNRCKCKKSGNYCCLPGCN